MSGTYQSAVLASEVCPEKIHIIDSMNVTVCLGLLVEEAVKLRDKGFSAKEIAEKIEALNKASSICYC
jgi:fatty acid-binding protein DegV